MMKLFHVACVLLVYQMVVTVRSAPCTSEQCSMKGQCYDVGQRWKVMCIKYKCVNVQGMPVAQERKKRCQWRNGRCKRIGTIKRHECTSFKCIETKNGKYVFSPIEKGCQMKGRCYKPDTEIRLRNRPPCFCTDEAKLVCAVN